MEATATASKTIADMIVHSASQFGDAPASATSRTASGMTSATRELADIVAGDRPRADRRRDRARRAHLHPCQHAPRLDLRRHGRSPPPARVVVPIYPTNSPEECEWVISDSAAIAIVCEDEEQLAEDRRDPREACRTLRTVILIDGADAGSESARALNAITLDEVRERGRGRDPEELRARREAVTLEDPYTFIYTSGTTGPPKGCVLSHGNYRAVVDMVNDAAELEDERDDLPVSPARARLRAADPAAVARTSAATLAYFGGDTKQIVPELMEVKPTYLPSVPRIFEKIYTLARGAIDAKPEEERRAGRRSDRARGEGPQDDGRGRRDPRAAARAVREGRRGAVQERPRDLRRPLQARDQRRRPDRPTRSSNSSTRAASWCSRATA